MYDVCGIQYVGQTNNVRSHMNGKKSNYRKFLNADFSKSDISVIYNLMMFKFSISKYCKFLKMKILNIIKTFAN